MTKVLRHTAPTEENILNAAIEQINQKKQKDKRNN
jgi:hypothetical protein